ncbi:hypothetical protein SAMN05880582_1086 [Rhizobium sp. RU20A]|uniref:hypothetical protein n=1 Tax=Rhizobium sp. RU20A TaxID=1907412 RepID=UPI0009545749|nr:hypothetical protein [Rhizobium sp. RU20A]SIR21215.1 hypothetical protein SAMN05880582_1086 [Rhizobium sp. RU20A]
MTNTIEVGATAPVYPHRIDSSALSPSLAALVDDVVTPGLSREALGRALDAGLNDVTAALRAVPVAEGKLLERGISLVAGANPDLIVLTQNLRLPVTRAASELVDRNDPALYRSLSLDADSGGRKSYTPDLLLLNRRTDVAHLVDVKRSLGSYELSRIAELKHRMLAAALVVPDLLYKEYRRLNAKEVRVVILNAANQRADIAGGVWPLSHLDHLLEVTGAGAAMAELRDLFQRRVGQNWTAALADQARITCERTDVPSLAPGDDAEPRLTPTDAADDPGQSDQGWRHRPPVSIGFARAPRAVGA